MKIAILVEGKTELALAKPLREFLKTRLPQNLPTLHFQPYNGRIPKEDKLKRIVRTLLNDAKHPYGAVIALTDVYTGTQDFSDGLDAKQKMSAWVGAEPRFHPHVAQYDFEAWLLPYWDVIAKLAKSNRKAPSEHPESVNHNKPPSKRLAELFETGKGRVPIPRLAMPLVF